MKRSIMVVLLIAIVLLSCPVAFAQTASDASFQSYLKLTYSEEKCTAHPDDDFVKNTVFKYAASMAQVSYNQVKMDLDDLGYSYETEIGEDELATFHMPCEEGSVYFCFYPLDISANSTAFGDPDREMLSCVEYSRDDKWITITDDFHLTETQFKIGDRNSSQVTRSLTESSYLLMFYNSSIGGHIVLGDDTSTAGEYARESEIKELINKTIKDYEETTLLKVTIGQNISTENPDDYILQVDLNWDVETSIKAIKKMLEMYTKELAINLSNNYPDAEMIVIRWDVPYLLDNGPVCKSTYRTIYGNLYLAERTGPLYQ